MSDLICLVADKNMEAVMEALFTRPQALGIQAIQHDVVVHPRRDPGCFHEAEEFLKTYRYSHAHALALLDHAWQGAPATTGLQLEEMLRERFRRTGLYDWAEVVVIDPELEVWVFSDSPWVDRCLGWSGRNVPLRAWLQSEQLWPVAAQKPTLPKVAVERSLHELRRPRSSSIYRDLATNVGLDRCTDAAFLRLRALLQMWFPAFAGERDASS
jgi:hypothetical protein